MEDDMDEYFMISMLLEGSQTMKTIDNETTKLSSDKFDVFIKNDHVVMVIDKRKDLYVCVYVYFSIHQLRNTYGNHRTQWCFGSKEKPSSWGWEDPSEVGN